jgi:hypothetical protein
MPEQHLSRHVQTWILVIKACAILTALLNIVVLGWSIWTLKTVSPNDLRLLRPFAWLGLFISAFMLLFCWRLFLLRIWAGLCVCLAGWIYIFEMFSGPGSITNDPAWPFEFAFIIIIFALSVAVFNAKDAWKYAV